MDFPVCLALKVLQFSHMMYPRVNLAGFEKHQERTKKGVTPQTVVVCFLTWKQTHFNNETTPTSDSAHANVLSMPSFVPTKNSKPNWWCWHTMRLRPFNLSSTKTFVVRPISTGLARHIRYPLELLQIATRTDLGLGHHHLVSACYFSKQSSV